MLLCQICKQRQATVHFTRIQNGQKMEMYVCEQCARENNELKINIHKLLSGIMGPDASKGVQDEPVAAVKCTSCGMTAEEFNKTGMLGCTDCYKAFGDSIQTLLKRIHGNVKHYGKVPINLSAKMSEARNLQQMKEELNKCIREENFEQAAILRDKIKESEKTKGHEVG